MKVALSDISGIDLRMTNSLYTWSNYWVNNLFGKDDLLTRHNNIDEDVFTESLEGLPAKILPATALFNGTDNGLINTSGTKITGGTPIDIEFTFILANVSGSDGVIGIGGQAAASKGITIILSSSEVITVLTSDGTTLNTAEFQDLNIADVGKKIRCRIQWDGITGHTMTCDIWGDAIEVFGEGTFDHHQATSTQTIAWFGDSSEAISIGCYRGSIPLGFWAGYIQHVKVAGIFEMYPTGLGKYEYDIIGGTTLTWIGTAGYTTFAENTDNLYYFKNGWKLYTKGADKEYLPYGASDAVIVAAGYVLADYGNYVSSESVLNMFPCLIDFDPDDGTDPLIDNLDRSNVTIATDLSRASAYYDVLNPYRWHINEIADPRIYTEFLNVGYAGKLYSKITTQLSGGNYYIKSLNEVLNFATDKLAEDQIKIMIYCGSNVFAI